MSRYHAHIISARPLLACLTVFAVAPSTAQIQFFVPNATIEVPAPGVINAFADDGRTLFIGVQPEPTQVYTRRGPLRWQLEGTLAPAPAPYGWVGMRDVDGDLAVGNATFEGPAGESSLAIIVYQRVGGVWQFTHALTAPHEAAVGFGNTFALDGDTIAISSWPGGTGAVFIYRRTASGDVFLQQEIDTEAFEQNVALDKGTLLIWAPDLQFPGNAANRVAVYELTDQGAVPVQMLLTNDPIRSETFGQSLAISGNVAVIGAPFSERRSECGFMSDRFGAGNPPSP